MGLKILVDKISVQIGTYFSQSYGSGESVRTNVVSLKMRDDEMDFCLMWVRFGILEFSRGQKYTTQIAIEYANPEYQYQYG